MATLQSVLTKIQSVKNAQTDLKDTIISKGVAVGSNIHLPDFSDMVDDIPNLAYANEGYVTLVSSADSITISNLAREPQRVGIVCEALLSAILASYTATIVVPTINATFPTNSNTVTVDGCVITKSQSNNVWTVTLSFANYNLNSGNVSNFAQKKFWGGYQYEWLVLFGAVN